MKFIIPGILGGIIGFFTNWLAIKMLFRPYEEKYFLGLKLPFTPGLIPKEQKRIAINIGETVESYLLSPESIIKFIDEEGLKKKIKTSINDLLIKLRREKFLVKELLGKNMDNEYPVFRKVINREIKNLILNEIKDEKHMNFLKIFILNKLNDKKLNKEIIDYIELEFKEFISGKDFENILNDLVKKQKDSILKDHRYLNDIVSEDIKKDLYKYLDENKRFIAYKVRTFVTSPSMEKKLKASISNMVEKNVSGIITTFVPIEIISEKIYEALKDYIKSDDANDDVNLLIKSIMEDLLNKKIYEIGKDLFRNIESTSMESHIIDFIQKQLLREDILYLIRKQSIEVDKEPLADLLINNIEKFVHSNKMENIIEIGLDNSFKKFEELEVIMIIDKLNINPNNIYDLLENIFNNSIKARLPGIIDSFNIGHIVENTIKDFEFDFVEKLILDIANKELRAITLLGGILGVFIGLLTPLIQML